MTGALKEAESNLGYTTILSPADGVVVARNITVGQSVAASLQAPNLFTIAEDLRSMQVQTNVAEKGEGYVKISVSEIDAEYEPGTDAALLLAGYATVTPLRPVCEACEVKLPEFVEAPPTGVISGEGSRTPVRAG